MNAVGNAEPIALAMFFAISACLSAPESARAQEARKSAADVEVLLYGSEQALVKAIEKRSDRQVDDDYRNELDRALSVLLARAYPKPKVQDLVQSTVDALCEQVQALTHAKIPNSQRTTWVETASRTKSFKAVLTDLEAIAAGQLTREQVVNAGLTAMLSATGSITAGVLSVPEAEWLTNVVEARETPSKERGMLGVDVSRWPVIEVLPGTAAEAGLRDGDVVLRVDRIDVAEVKTSADALKALRGTAGTRMSLTIKRGDQTLTFNVRRAFAAERIKASVIVPGVVYIQIPLFEGSGIAARVNELIRTHVTDAISDVILDVRDNSAGRPEETNAVADIFLDEKFLQIFQFRDGRRVAFKSKPGALDIRVIVLTNRNTASCAEMLALALHDNHRATVIGQPTAGALFGKDWEKLADGRMIIFRSEPTILSPTGHDYSETGLPPDVIVDESLGSDEDEILARAIEFARTGREDDTSRRPMP